MTAVGIIYFSGRRNHRPLSRQARGRAGCASQDIVVSDAGGERSVIRTHGFAQHVQVAPRQTRM